MSECPVCHLRRDEDFDDLDKHLRLYHSKEDLAQFILKYIRIFLDNNQKSDMYDV